MARTSTKKLKHERCWTLLGRRQGPFWHACRRRPTQGGPASVAFDPAWVIEREESRGDVIGFYHTHPGGMPGPSQRDHRTMRAWVGSFGKPLLCLIEADGVVNAYLYVDDEVDEGIALTACELLPRGIVVAYDSREANSQEANDDQQVPA